MKELLPVDRERIEFLIAAQDLNMAEKNDMLRLVKTYIDEGASMCMTCDPQVRAMWRRLAGWYDLYKNKNN